MYLEQRERAVVDAKVAERKEKVEKKAAAKEKRGLKRKREEQAPERVDDDFLSKFMGR